MRRKLPVQWSLRASLDLAAHSDFIAQDDPAAAARWEAQMTSSAESLASSPARGRRVPEYPRPDVRELILGSYRLVYQLLAERIVVVAVLEGHRRLPPLDLQ